MGITIWAIVFIHIISNIRMALASAMMNMESPFVIDNKYKVVSLLVRIPNLPKVKQGGLFRRQFKSETHINKLSDTDLQQFGRRLVAHHGGKLGKANLHFFKFFIKLISFFFWPFHLHPGQPLGSSHQFRPPSDPAKSSSMPQSDVFSFSSLAILFLLSCFAGTVLLNSH